MLRTVQGTTVSLASKAAGRHTSVSARCSPGLLRRALPPHASAYLPLRTNVARAYKPPLRGYASQPPGGGQGGFPGFSFAPQQRQKGEALKEYVRNSVDITFTVLIR